MGDVQADHEVRGRGGGEDQITGTAGQIQYSIARRDRRQPDEAALPAAVLSVRKKPRDEIVAIGDGGKEPANVAALAFSGGER